MSPSPARIQTPPASRTGGSRTLTWTVRAAVAALLLVGAGVAREVRAARIRESMAAGLVMPFKLDDIPMKLGTWTGETVKLDSDVIRGTGSDALITRRYVDGRTGVALEVIVLHGPASGVFIHSPDLCYPKAGFGVAGEKLERPVATPGGPRPFRATVYIKGDGGRVDCQDVYHSWYFNESWSTEVPKLKETARIPGMYKVQIARAASRSEARTEGNPCEAFLEQLIPDLEARIAGRTPPPAEPAQPKS